MAIAVVDNSSPTSGNLNDVAWDAYNATVAALLTEHDSAGAHNLTAYVTKALFDANTILYTTTDDTPVALTVAASRIIGRASSGAIAALTAAQVLTLIGVESGATADQTEADILTLLGLTSGEVDQVGNLGATTVSATQWGYVGAMTKDPIGGDATAGRIVRTSYITIANGSNASTLKCTLVSRWNGDAIAETDNVAKGATTGSFTLDAAGTHLRVEAAGLTGNVLYTLANIIHNASNTSISTWTEADANDIEIQLKLITTGTAQDMTVLVDTGIILLDILYITDA
ncbi:hypothetical protein LCGC14_0611240 [marine sediment metagenome]|uniref:Uncharacterized protein n=1 Tax=marine sediment metagenome TaxID=412755 RepID=A0A0F9RRV5_9ZZZZ